VSKLQNRPHKLQLLREIALLRERSRDITMGSNGSSVYDSNGSNSDSNNSYNEDAASVGIYEVSNYVFT
jgi:hypothetical protein